MPKKTYKNWSDAHYCDACRQLALIDGTVVVALATHSVTDAHEKGAGAWEESKPRFGCALHRVVSIVFYLSGDVLLLGEVPACQ